MEQNERKQLNVLLSEAFSTVNSLYHSVYTDIGQSNMLLHILNEQLGLIFRFVNATSKDTGPVAHAMAMPDGLQNYTLSELAEYNNKNGNPAYVAVNGVVYDVTNNAAWAAASHFGLSAGKELSGAHASCHANQDVLSKLKVVGRLEDGNAQL